MAAFGLTLLGGCDLLFHLDRVSAGAPGSDGGAGSDGVVDADPTLRPRVIFVTSQMYNGNLGGLAGADTKCGAAAAIGSLPGTFKAWLSSSTMDASLRMVHPGGPFKLPDGTTTVAMTWGDLTDGTLLKPINVTESGIGVASSGGCDVWTNTGAGGARTSNDNNATCSDWSDNANNSPNTEGNVGAMTALWTANSLCSVSCAAMLHLYCIEQ
jgi:hypothetical protein